MKAIQFILISILLTVVLVYVLRLRSRLMDRLVVLFFGITAMIMVVMPEWTQKLARLLGVGRGVDLIIYLSLVGLSFVCLLLFSKLREVNQQVTDLTRAHAIAHAHLPEGKKTN